MSATNQFGGARADVFFTHHQLFGFTGTPIFAENASKNDLGKRTTRDLFEITSTSTSLQTPSATRRSAFGVSTSAATATLRAPSSTSTSKPSTPSTRRNASKNRGLHRHHRCQNVNRITSICTESIDNLIAYYETRKKEAGEHTLSIAPIFTYRTNEKMRQRPRPLGRRHVRFGRRGAVRLPKPPTRATSSMR